MNEKSWDSVLTATKWVLVFTLILAFSIGLVTTCVVTGALVGEASQHPALGFLAALAVYFGLDGGIKVYQKKFVDFLFPIDEAKK